MVYQWFMAFWPRQSAGFEEISQPQKRRDLLAQLIIMIGRSYSQMMMSLVWEALAFSASAAHSQDLINCRVKLISFQLCSRIISSFEPPRK